MSFFHLLSVTHANFIKWAARRRDIEGERGRKREKTKVQQKQMNKMKAEKGMFVNTGSKMSRIKKTKPYHPVCF